MTKDNLHKANHRSAFALLCAGVLMCAGSLFLSGCAETTLVVNSAKRIGNSQTASAPVPAGGGRYKIGSPYQIQGKWYTPKEDMSYVEVGVASWYGPNFHGKSTANGETFDMYAMTAAHRTLPMPSVVRVTNLANNRSVILRVNDRGPFARDRILDVSKAAAQALDFIKQGTTRVKVEILPQESVALKNRMLNGGAKTQVVQHQTVKPVQTVQTGPVLTSVKPAPSAQPMLSGASYIQVGAFGSVENATRLRDRLANLGNVTVQDVKTSSGALLHKVRIGPIMGQQNTDAVLREVHSIGFTDAHVLAPKS